MTTLLPFRVGYCFALPPHLAQVRHRLGGPIDTRPRDPEDMARHELLGQEDLLRARAGVGFMMSEEDIGGGDEEDDLVCLCALRGERAFEEGAQEGVER